MKVSRLKLAGIIAAQTKRMPSTKLSKQLAAYLLSEGRTKELDSLLRDVLAIRAENGLVEADVDSAHELKGASSQINKLIKKLHPKAKTIILNHQVKPELIGGVKVSLPNQQIDLSIREKLNRFKQLASKGAN